MLGGTCGRAFKHVRPQNTGHKRAQRLRVLTQEDEPCVRVTCQKYLSKQECRLVADIDLELA